MLESFLNTIERAVHFFGGAGKHFPQTFLLLISERSITYSIIPTKKLCLSNPSSRSFAARSNGSYRNIYFFSVEKF